MIDVIDKNDLYHGIAVPDLAARAVALARQNDFPFSCTPNQGRLLQVLAGGREIIRHGPFDLLVLDGGGSGKHPADPPAEPARLLVPGGTVVMDDMHPPADG